MGFLLVAPDGRHRDPLFRPGDGLASVKRLVSLRVVILRRSLAAGHTSPSKEGTMSYAKQMLDSYSRTIKVDNGVLAANIAALNDCAQPCAADVAADLGEQDVAEMVKCIRLCPDCTDI